MYIAIIKEENNFQMKKYTYLYLGFVLCTNLVMMTSASSQVITTHTSIQKNGPSEDYLQALLRFEPWAESVWKDYPKIPNSGYFGDGASDGNGGIRGTIDIAFTYYVLIRAFPDASERQHRLKRVEAALRYAEETYLNGPSGLVTVDGKKWGADPTSSNPNDQAGIYAAQMGLVAALLEKELDPKVVAGCKGVVAAGKSFRSKIPPPSGCKR